MTKHPASSAPTANAASAPSPAPRGSARERLLDAAAALFYEEGIQSVGIDRVIERAGVAKASLYDCFGSKEALVKAYLERRQQARRTRLNEGLARFRTPRTRLLGVFDVLGESFAEPGYRGCVFVRANVESRPDSSLREVCNSSREWMLDLLVQLSREAGARDPHRLARQLMMLYDGATVAAQMEGDASAAATARSMAAELLDAETGGA